MRVSGDTRFDTAIEIAKEIQVLNGKKPDTIYLANSHDYQNTAAGSIVAALSGKLDLIRT